MTGNGGRRQNVFSHNKVLALLGERVIFNLKDLADLSKNVLFFTYILLLNTYLQGILHASSFPVTHIFTLFVKGENCLLE